MTEIQSASQSGKKLDQHESLISLVTLQGPLNGIQESNGKESSAEAHPHDFSLFMLPQQDQDQYAFRAAVVNHQDIDFQMCLSNRLGKPSQRNEDDQECAVEISTVSLTSPFDINESIIEKASSQKKPEFDSAIRQLQEFDEQQSANIPRFAQPEIRKISFENEQPPPERRRDLKVKPTRAQNENFIAENLEQALVESKKRNCKSSSRVKKSLQDAQSFPIALSGQMSQGTTVQVHQIPLTAGRHGQVSLNAHQNTGSIQANKEQFSQNQMKLKFQLNLKGLNSTSGGSTYSASYSNKDLSERFQVVNQAQQSVNPSIYSHNVDTLPATNHKFPSTNDPYMYLHARQQKHKSSRSAYPQHQAYLLQHPSHLNSRSLRGKRGASGPRPANIEMSSSYSNSSQRATPVSSLTDVKNPSLLIQFRFVNRKATELNDITRFRNLTDLDVSGNLLQTDVPELMSLKFLKKLNLSFNQIEDMWKLPQTLEILNISNNSLKQLDADIIRQLGNLTTLEVSNNGLNSLDGVESLNRLKRLVAKHNQISEVDVLKPLSCLIEIDLENNPIDNGSEVLSLIRDKKDILVLNLKLSPLMVRVSDYDEFIEQMHMLGEPDKHIESVKLLLKYFNNGVLYRNKKVFLKVRQQLSLASKARSSNHSQGSSSQSISKQGSYTHASFSPLLNQVTAPNTNSGNNPHRREDRFASTGSQLQKINSQDMYGPNNYEAIEILYDKILEEEDKILLQQKKKEMRLKRERRRQNRMKKLNGESYIEELDESKDVTLSANDSQDVLEDLSDSQSSGDDLELQSYDNLEESPNKNDREGFLNESTADFNKQIKQINQELQREGILDRSLSESEKQDINVDVNLNESKQQSVKKLPIFKLDLSKCHTSQTELWKSPEKLEDQEGIDQSAEKLMANDENQCGQEKEQMHSEDSKKPTINQKQILIPRLALQKIQHQTSEPQNSQSAKTNVASANDQVPKSLKVLSSKRGLLETSKAQEAILMGKLEQYERLIQDIKNALGEAIMDNSSIVDRILKMKRQQESCVEEMLAVNNRCDQQVKELQQQIEQLKQQQEVLEQQKNPSLQDKLLPRQKDMGFSLRLADINKVIKMDEEVQMVKTGRGRLSSRIKSSGRLKQVAVPEGNQTIAVRSGGRGLPQFKNLPNNDGPGKIEGAPEQADAKQETQRTEQPLTSEANKGASPERDLKSPETAVNLELGPPSEEKNATITSNYFDKAKEKIMSVLKKGQQAASNKRTNSMIETNRHTEGSVEDRFTSEQLKSESHQRMKIQDYVMVERPHDKNKTYRSNNFYNFESSSRIERDGSVGSSKGYNSQSSATQKVGVYLEKMRERNSSLQERLSHSFKTVVPSSLSRHHAVTQRPSTSLYARVRSGMDMHHGDNSRTKMLQTSKTPNQLSLHGCHKSQSVEDSINTGREDNEAKVIYPQGKHSRCRNERVIIANHLAQEGSTINYSDFLYQSSTVKHNTTSSQPLITVDEPHIVFEEQRMPLKPYQKVLRQLQATTTKAKTQNISDDFADMKSGQYSTLLNKQRGEENLIGNRENANDHSNQRGRVYKNKKVVGGTLIGSSGKTSSTPGLKMRALKTDRANYSTNILTGRSNSKGVGRVSRQQAAAKKQKTNANNKLEV